MSVVFVNAYGQSVFDGQDLPSGATFLQPSNQILKTHTRKDFHVGTAQLASRLFTESSALSLKCDDLPFGLHRFTPSQRRT